MPADKKIRRASPKKAKTAGAVKRKKAVKPRNFARQPENFGFSIRLTRDAHSGFRIKSGCRDFSPRDAKLHWRSNAERIGFCRPGCSQCDERQARALNMLALLPKLKQRARRYGWL